MRIHKMITKRKIFDLLSTSLNLFFKKMYADQSGEFVCGYLGLRVKKIICNNISTNLKNDITTIFLHCRSAKFKGK